MGQKVTIGGDRIGSGNQMKTELNNYGRSTHNLSRKWASTMAPGILYPFMVIPCLRGDKFEIDLEAAARTIPTKGPLFGSYKMQMDVFQCPVRLYQALLHNNPTDIGLKMKDVYLPTIDIETNGDLGLKGGFSNSCLLKYLGMSGLGVKFGNAQPKRKINAVPILAYYDIFKNYYSNKQEEYAYVISPKDDWQSEYSPEELFVPRNSNNKVEFGSLNTTYQDATVFFSFECTYTNLIPQDYNPEDYGNALKIKLWSGYVNKKKLLWEGTIAELDNIGGTVIYNTNRPYTLNIQINRQALVTDGVLETTPDLFSIEPTYEERLALEPFKLKNIDDMRMELLSFHEMGESFSINTTRIMPYSTLYSTNEYGQTYNEYAHNGLVVKTYQSDLFNNWVNTEWIDGENGIAEMTKIAVQDGAFKIDALNLAEKLYNMLNRVAISGGTYEDWQTAVYMESPRRHIESPIYLGGMSNEVVFEEIISSASTESAELGTLGGRGILVKRKGGNINVKVDEASYIIGIVSLTPRIYQTQGNEWYLTELKTLDDMHKPALDGIGFQNLIGERMAWFDTQFFKHGGEPQTMERHTIGKVPAWIEYMTAVDTAYGDFADIEGKGFMILNRNYEQDVNGIKDATTYIDPTKYNYAFAYTELDAQNFWVQINAKIIARRLMSAKQIPNV